MDISHPNCNNALKKIANLSTPDRVLIYPKVIVILLFIAWPISIFGFGQPPLDSGGTFIGNDFVAFYTGVNLWQNESKKIYNFKTQQMFQFNLIKHLLSDKESAKNQNLPISPFINPPISILLYFPFSQEGYLDGLVLWWSFGFLTLGLSIHFMQKYIPGLDRWSRGKLWGMTIMFFPTLAWIMYGQATALILCIWVICYVLLRSKREFGAGLVLSCLVFKPQLGLALALPLIVRFRFRALLGGIAGLSWWALLTYWIFPDEFLAYRQQVNAIMELLRHKTYPTWGIHSFYGFSNLAIYPVAPKLSNIFTAILSILGIMACARIWWKADWSPGSEDWNTRLAVSIPLCLLLAIQLFTYDLMLLLFPYFLIISQMRYWSEQESYYLDGGPVLAWTSLVYCVCFFSGYFTKFIQELFQFANLPQIGFQLTTVCIIGWCWAVWQHHKSHVTS